MRMAQVSHERALSRVYGRILGFLGAPGSHRAALFAAVALLSACCGAAVGWGSSRASGVMVTRAADDAVRAEPVSDAGAAPSETTDDADGETGELVVDVGGAVNSPGVVRLADGARVEDALESAGGLTPDADTVSINRAAPLTDGMKVHVPRVGESPSSAPEAGGAEPAATELVSINHADEGELDALPGVGPATAAAIVEDREKNGPFSTLEDLMRVSGIGEKKYEDLVGLICL